MPDHLHKTFLAALGACLCFAFVPPLKAQNGVSEYARIGDWTVYSYEFSKFCRVIKKHDDGSAVRVSKGDAEAGALRIKIDDGTYEEARGAVTFAFDDVVLDGQWLGTRYFMVRGPEEGPIPHLRAAQEMEVRIDGEVAHSYSLKGSAAAYRALSRCASQWPGATVPVVPPPAPPISTTSRSAKRYARPIEPQTWIAPSDFASTLEITERVTVGVSISIGASGDATACKITKPTNYPEIDDRICALLVQRAKFEPALSFAGEPIASRYSTRISYDPAP